MKPGKRDTPTFELRSEISTIKCYGLETDDRVCVATDFCFDHKKEKFIFYVESKAAKKAWDALPDPIVVLSSKQGIWNMFREIEVGQIPGFGTHMEEDFSVIYRQYVEGNTYHTIGEDFLPGFHTASFFTPDVAQYYHETQGEEAEPVHDAIDKRIKLFFLDWINQGHYDVSKAMYLWTTLTDKPLSWGGLHWERDPTKFGSSRTCWKMAAFASPRFPRSQDDGWFAPPQMPAYADGVLSRIAVDFVLKQMDLPPTLFSSLSPTPYLDPTRASQLIERADLDAFQNEVYIAPRESCTVSFISRKRTRVVKNEEELISALQRADGVTSVQVVDEDGLPPQQIIEAMRGTDVLIGMHGAGLAWGIFMPYGSDVIELTSYGSQPEFFTYFKNLFSLPDFGVNYHMWQNNNASVAYGPRGGLVESVGILSKSNEEIIECLTMPIKRHPYQWGSHCLNYWRDHDNAVAVTDIAELASQACRRAGSKP